MSSTRKFDLGPQVARERIFVEIVEAAGLTAADAVPGQCPRVPIRAITDDSREVTAASCFVAIPGCRQHGCRFVEEATRRGASAIVSEEDIEVPPGVGFLRVADARSALARLSAAWYGLIPRDGEAGLKLIGVTGTNGKSTTCALLRSILSEAGHPTALLGTISYDLIGASEPALWTTPPPTVLCEKLARARDFGATHAVMEVSSHALSQRRCDGLRFDAAVFTNLSGDHLDYHDTPQAYAQAKKRLFDMLDEKAVAVVNADDAHARDMVQSCCAERIWYGLSTGAHVGARVDSLNIEGSRMTLHLPEGRLAVALSLVGKHNVANALAAAATASALGIDTAAIRRGLGAVRQVDGRLQRVDTDERGFALFVDYAHTDDALAKVLEGLTPLTAGKLICVFGCGGDRDRSKRPRMARAVARWAHLAIVTSANPRSEEPLAIIREIVAGFTAGQRCGVEIEPDRRSAIALAVASARPGDTVLIAGKGHEDYQIIGDKKWHFDDVEVARQCLAAREGRAA